MPEMKKKGKSPLPSIQLSSRVQEEEKE